MALKLYRRHRRDCKGRHPEDTRTGQFEEGRRGWKKCACHIFAAGTLGGNFRRMQTGKTDWNEAKAVAAVWEGSQSWDGPGKPAEPTPPVPDTGRVKITDAIAAFLHVREAAKIAPSTMRKYRTFAKQLRVFADRMGHVMLDQFTAADMDAFYAGWPLAARTKAKALGTLRAFFRFAMNREWLTKNPVTSDLKPPLGANRVTNKAPFSDDELKRILDACDRVGVVQWKNGGKSGIWTGNDAKDFVYFLTYTGLRISDAGLFRMDRMRGNEVFLRAKKNGGDVFTWIPDWLVERLVQRANHHGPRPFLSGQSDRLETVTDLWRRRLNKVFALAGKFEERPTAHRFRHTFARILLQRGVPVPDVADLLGDDENTVREHYARWVPERQARLTNILRDAFDDRPRPKLVALPGKK
jgi:integrase